MDGKKDTRGLRFIVVGILYEKMSLLRPMHSREYKLKWLMTMMMMIMVIMLRRARYGLD
jgi:hypothetical protein